MHFFMLDWSMKTIILFDIFVVGGGTLLFYLWFKKPFYRNIFNAIRRFIYGSKGIAIRVKDLNGGEIELIEKIHNGDSFIMKNGQYVIIPPCAIKRQTKTEIEYIENFEEIIKAKEENKKIIPKPKFKLLKLGEISFNKITQKPEIPEATKYKIDKTKGISRFWGREIVFDYLLGYPMPLTYDIPEHIKKCFYEFQVSAEAMKTYMASKIFVDKVYDPKEFLHMRILSYITLGISLLTLALLAYIKFSGNGI